jgi:hypothetical protein
MIYAVQMSKPDGETYLVRYQSENDGGRLDGFCGPLTKIEQDQAIREIHETADWEYEGFEDNDVYERFEIAVVGSISRAWFDSDTGEAWRE